MRLWKNISGETRLFFKWRPKVSSQVYILLLNIAKLQPTHKLQTLHPHAPSALQDGCDLESVPITSSLGLCFWGFFGHKVSLENEHPLLILVTSVSGCYRLHR